MTGFTLVITVCRYTQLCPATPGFANTSALLHNVRKILYTHFCSQSSAFKRYFYQCFTVKLKPLDWSPGLFMVKMTNFSASTPVFSLLPAMLEEASPPTKGIWITALLTFLGLLGIFLLSCITNLFCIS